MKRVNAIGQTCPIPVIMTKKALKEIEEGVVEVSVDNIISKENIEKFAKEQGFKSTSRTENDIFYVTIEKTLIKANENEEKKENIVVVIASDKMGEGADELGETLMKVFIYTLGEMEQLPNTILLYNKGVLLASKVENTIKDLKALEERGVEILSCGACANFYHVEKDIQVGTITNMYNIIDKQLKASKVIRP